MMARSIALCVLLAGSSAALGGVEVILSPQTAGPYSPGQTVAVDVLLSQVPAGDPLLLRLVQFDVTVSDAGLSIVLPTTHATAGVSFWDFSTVPDCAALDADCGVGHFIDDDLPGTFPAGPDVIVIVYVGDLADPNNPDLNENFNQQWLLMGDGTAKKIGELQVTLPTVAGLPTSCMLDVLNAGDGDVAFGARVDFGFSEAEGRTTWRASAGEITGGTLDLCASSTCPASILSWASIGTHARGVGGIGIELSASDNSSESRLSGVSKIVVTFDNPINPSTAIPGNVSVSGCDLNDSPVDLSGIAIGALTASGDTEMVITFTPKLPDVGRYLISLSGVQCLDGSAVAGDTDRVVYAVLGDASGDRRVTTFDVGGVRSFVGTDPIDGGTLIQVRSDANNDGRITTFDVAGVRSRVGIDTRAISCP